MERRFVESEDSLFEKVPSPLFRVQREGGRFIFTDANAAGHLLTGGKIADLYGREVSEIWSSPKSRHIAENIKRVQQTRQMREETFWHTFVSDRKRRYVHINYVPYRDDEVLLFVYDLTDNHEQSESLDRMNVRYRALFERASKGMLEGMPDEIRDCNQQICAMYGYSKPEFLKLSLDQLLYPHELSGLLTLLDEVAQRPHEVQEWQGRVVRKDGSIFWVSASITGLLDQKGELRHFLASVEDITEQRQAEEKLRNALVDTVKAVAATVAIHDRYTAGHMQRVAGSSVEIGKAMGLSEDELLGLSLGASIFDIGKIGIPSSILSKPGKLTEAEFELIKEHPVLGVEVISNIEFSWPIREMIHQHHERLDGSGYPDGLRDDEIILEARIIAVADVYESLISHRPYRAANDLESARLILAQEKGRLEPEIVDCLFSLIDKGLLGISEPA